MVILHLSDIHFGRVKKQNETEDIFVKKNEILQGLLESIEKVQFRIDHIIVTGDIAWFGKKKDFDEALVWFRNLLSVTHLSGKDVTFSPGNHDVNRQYWNSTANINFNDIDKIDEIYKYDNVYEFETPLYNYEKFCEALGVVPFHYPKSDTWVASYSLGYKDITLSNENKMRIVSFDTTVLSSIKGYPDDKMVIGQKQVYELKKYGIIGENTEIYKIAIFHHAERFLHENEICEYNYRTATLPLLRKNVDLILCGHTETGGIPVMYEQIGGAKMLTGGASYFSDEHANSYSVILLSDNLDEKGRRYIALSPYVYSAKQGWHLNKQVDNNVTETIDTDIPLFDSRDDYVLILKKQDEKKIIPIKCISAYYDTIDALKINNFEDVCRMLDIECVGPTKERGTARVAISMHKEKEYNVRAMLELEETFSFINDCSKQSSGTSFKIINGSGDVVLSGENIFGKADASIDVVSFLKEVKNIEDTYDVMFKCPDDNSDSYKVEILNKIIKDGFSDAFKPFETSTIDLNDEEKLRKLCECAKDKKSFDIICEDEFRCKLFGCDFSLGKALVYMGKYEVDYDDALYKLKTFKDGDSRRIILKKQADAKCWFIFDKEKYFFNKGTIDYSKCIILENMNIQWDYIYEVQRTIQNNHNIN